MDSWKKKENIKSLSCFSKIIRESSLLNTPAKNIKRVIKLGSHCFETLKNNRSRL
jgi:hypothetical protein